MKNQMVKTCGFLMAALVLLMGGATLAGAIEVRPAAPGELQVAFQPTKPVYAPGEPIEFRIKANKPFFLYLFCVDQERNTGYVLLPNAMQQENHYQAFQEYMIPGGRFQLVGEKAGTEKIVMLASTEKLDVQTDRFNKGSTYFSGDAASVEAEIKALRVRAGEPKKEHVVQELTLVIAGN